MTLVHENINKTRSGKRVLVAPLDWGLGHATRCIPVIHELLHQGFEVLVAAEKKQAQLLHSEFPGITILGLEGYNISYSKSKFFFFFNMLLQAPRILRTVKRENRWLQKVIDDHGIDIVISDNRFGLYSKKAHCIFITHQLFIATGNSLTEKTAQRINYQYIRKYDECWVPDAGDGLSLAGRLSHPEKKPAVPVKYIGPLTRFVFEEKTKNIDLLFLLSGPEPQRSLLENILIQQAANIKGKKIVLVRGLPGNDEPLKVSGIETFSHLPAAALNDVILRSGIVIARSGYSTVMDLAVLRSKAVFIPTPGQTEQEYLAEYLSGKNGCIPVSQDQFDLSEVLRIAEQNTLEPLPVLSSGLSSFISDLL